MLLLSNWSLAEGGLEKEDEQKEDPPAEIENEVNSDQLSQACEGVTCPAKKAAFSLKRENVYHLNKNNKVKLYFKSKNCAEQEERPEVEYTHIFYLSAITIF